MAKLERQGQTVLAALRGATGQLHSDLDQMVQGQRILDGRLTRPKYVRMLRSHLALHRLVEAHTTACQARGTLSFLDWPQCDRLSALVNDLAQLDATPVPDHDALQAVPLAGASVAAGLLYVVEGACHGTGQMLRALDSNPTFKSWNAASFMHVSKATVATRWRATLALVTEQGALDLDGLTRGAVDGFRFYAAAWRDPQVTEV